MSTLQTIPARGGKAAHVAHGQAIRIVNTHGEQVVDTWAFRTDDLSECMSMEHTRGVLLKLIPGIGDTFYSSRRRAMLTLVEDTSQGIHDTLLAACNDERYQQLGCTVYHDNCTDNLTAAMAELGLKEPETPSPLNLFMNIPWTGDGTLAFEEPRTRPGDYVVLRAEMDCIVAMSACPQDMVPINGADCVPTEAHFEIIDTP
ncbi:MAG: DUF1989 domain-containing protein [Hyphomicrobiales bacterium]